MLFSSAILTAHLRNNRIAHTYLFSGPEGPNKEALVLGFAKALNCREGKAFEACLCESCRKIEKASHPDVKRLGEDEKARSIKMEEVRALLHEASLKPFEGRWKVFILKGAERLTLEAANALLKTLEEPPGHSVFLLLVENKAHLLETIQSRAFEIRTPPPPEKNPLEVSAIQLLEKEGWPSFFKALQGLTRPDLPEVLEAFMLYLRNRYVLEGNEPLEDSERTLKAIDSVYEVQEALHANVNQKLALTRLEIQLGELGSGLDI